MRDKTGVDIEVLPGEDEARLTFLAVRRWFGWSSGRLAVFDIGGGSLEIAVGSDEAPDVAQSLPLGAGRLTRDHLAQGVDRTAVRELRRRIRADIARDAGSALRSAPDHAVATSKTFRSLARICGAAPAEEGLLVRRVLDGTRLRERIPDLLEMTPEEVADLPGVSTSRSHQIVAGALVAEAVLDLFDLDELELCPWALREGIILERLDRIVAPVARSLDQVGVLLVPLDVGPDERAQRPHRPPRPSYVVQGAAHEDRADALALLGVVDLGVGEHDRVATAPVGREAEHRPVGTACLVAVLVGVVDDLDVGLRHGDLRIGWLASTLERRPSG